MQLRADISFAFDTEHDIEIANLVDKLLELLYVNGTMIGERIVTVRGGKGDVVNRDPERFKRFAPVSKPSVDPEMFMAVQEAEKRARDYLYEENLRISVQGMTHVPHG